MLYGCLRYTESFSQLGWPQCHNRTGGCLQTQYHELKKCQKQSLHHSYMGETDYASF